MNDNNKDDLARKKIDSLMNFLDDVENTANNDVATIKNVNNVNTNKTQINNNNKTTTTTTTLAAVSAFAGIRSKVQSLKEQLKDKDKIIEQLQMTIKQWHEKSQDEMKNIISTKDEEIQRYMKALDEQTSFVTNLVKEKEELLNKCELNQKKLQMNEEKYHKIVEDLKLKHKDEGKRRKSLWLLEEKKRREKWMSSKTKEIKQNTIKGLEPELQRLMNKHKLEIQQLEKQHELNMEELRQNYETNTQERIQKVKLELMNAHDIALEEERNHANDRLRQQIEKYDEQMQQQRIEYHAKIELERNELNNNLRKERALLQQRVDEASRSESQIIHNLENKHMDTIAQLQRKHTLEIKKIREENNIEKEHWQSVVVKKLNNELEKRAHTIETQALATRDKQIKEVVERLAAEYDVSNEAIQKQHELKLKEWEHKYQENVESLQKKLDISLQKCVELEEECKKFKNEENIQNNWSQKYYDTQTQLKSLQKQYNILETDNETRLNKLRQELETNYVQQIDELHNRFKKAVEKKDLTLNSLREQLASRDERIHQIESLLEQFRQQI